MQKIENLRAKPTTKKNQTGKKMTPKVVAYILIVTDIGKEYEVIQELKKIKAVAEAKAVYGDFDIITRIESADLKALDDAVTGMRKIPSIIRTTTLISS